MRISFDIDGLLVCAADVASETPRCRLMRWRRIEPLRDGAVELIRALKQRQCEVRIYTTSYRSSRYVRRWLRAYGIRIDGVVNRIIHERVMQGKMVSKYPPAFGIDLHIDDAEGVADEGNRYGFAVMVIRPDTVGWTSLVIAAVDKFISERK